MQLPRKQNNTKINSNHTKKQTTYTQPLPATEVFFLILALNNFIFNSINYLQIKGCEMVTLHMRTFHGKL